MKTILDISIIQREAKPNPQWRQLLTGTEYVNRFT